MLIFLRRMADASAACDEDVAVVPCVSTRLARQFSCPDAARKRAAA
jgi:hypothetical protein